MPPCPSTPTPFPAAPGAHGDDASLRDGALTMTDGPFAETKEQLAGFYLIDAADLDEAVTLAARIPPVRADSVEVRPVRELDPSR